MGPGAFDPVPSLIAVNVVVYILSLFLSPSGMGISMNPLRFLSPSEGSLFLLGATGTVPVFRFGRWWSLLTASFLHGGLLHLFFNMVALSQLGPFVYLEFGFCRFFALYIVSGIAGFLLSLLAGVPFTIGASASVCGLIGAILYYGKSRGGFFGEAIYRQAMGWVVGLVIFGLLVPGINNWAHGGGIMAGLAAAWVLGYHERNEETLLHCLLGWGLLALTGLAILWAVIQGVWRVWVF